VAFVVTRERADRTLQEPGDSQYFLNVPELGIIPAAETARGRHYYLGRKKDEETGRSLVALRAEPISQRTPELVTWQEKPSMVAEAFRVVLTSILFSGQNGTRPKILVLTSPSPREGKSTVTSNLAIAMAQVNKRTLLIDADLRRPRQDAIFQVPNDRGLSDFLGGTYVADQAKEIIRETKIPGLYILPSGPSSPIASNLLFSKAMPDLLEHLKQDFDMVLIDTPPMLQMPDARVLGRMAGAVILVLRAGSTTRDAALAARQRFAEDKTNLLGTILNDWNPKSSPGGYYGSYKGYGGGYYRYEHTARSGDRNSS
jgi:capsular exopolysaccharide synthesis family protein